MKKKVALILVAAAMLLSACSSSSTPVSSVETESEVPTSSTEASSSEVASAASSTDTAASSIASSTTASATSVAASVATTSKAASSKAASSKATTTSKAASTPAGALGVIGSNPTCKLPQKLDLCVTGFMGESTDYPDQKEYWEKTMSDRYGVKIHVTLPPKADVNTFLTTHIAAGDLLGLVYRYSPDDVVNAMYAGYIMPLDDYVKDNKVWNSLPENMRNNYKIDGKLWAIPWGLGGVGTGVMWSRYFREDWMTKLGLSVPKTVDDTKNVCTQFATKDPDGSGTNNDNIGITFGGEWTWRDLFAAQDAVTFEQGLNIGYNVETNAYEDSYLRPGAKSVFELFRYFYMNKICDTTALTVGFTDLRTKLSSGIVGSTFFYGGQGRYTWGPTVYANMLLKAEGRKPDYDNIASDWTKATNIYEEVSMITGTRTKNMWFTTQDGGPWTLMKGTPQPKEQVNFWIDMMFSGEDTFIETMRQTKNYWYKNSDGTFTLKYKDAANKVGYASASLHVYVEPSVYPVKTYGQFYYEGSTARTRERSKEVSEFHAARDAKGLSSGQLYTIKPEYKTVRSTTYQKYNGDVYNYAVQLLIQAATSPDVTVDKALADYKKNMANIGGDTMLKEANSAFGLTNNYQSYTK